MSRRCRWLGAIGLLLVSSAALAAGDPGWVLTTADFKQQPVALESIGPQGVRVTPTEGPARTVAYDAFLQVERASAQRGAGGGAAAAGTAPTFALLLVSGDRLLGEPKAYVDEQIVWKNAAVGELNVPLQGSRALVRNGRAATDLDKPRTDDLVRLANGDRAVGIVTDLTATKVKLNSNGADLELPLESVDWIHFATAARPKAAEKVAFRVRLADGGSTLTAESVEFGGGKELTVALSAKDRRKVPLASVASVEQLNGPVSWLSSRAPEQVVQLPFYRDSLTRTWPTRMDASVLDDRRTGLPLPIRFGGRTYARGIGVHAYSRVDYALDGSYKAFRTQYAIAPDENPKAADVTVRILLDGKAVHEKEHVKADQLSPVVVVELPAGAKLLTLEVDYGAGQHWQDRFNWIEPALLREVPKADPPPPPPPAPPTTAPATAPTTAPATQPAQ